MYVSRMLARQQCRLLASSTLHGHHLPAAWPRKQTGVNPTVTSAKQRNRRDRQEDEGGVDSTNELLLDSVQSSKGDVLDIDELLNDEAAMGALRAMLKAEMAAAQSSASGTAAATARQQPARPRNRAFDSDEYDTSALESMLDSHSNSLDVIASDAAKSLLLESQEIAEQILQEHEGDSMLRGQQRSSTRGDRKQNSSNSSSPSKDSSFKLKLPAFAAGGKNSDRGSQQQQQQQGRASKGKPTNSSSSSSRGGSPGQGSRGSSGADGGGSDGGSKGRGKLSVDTAIGRVCEAKGGVPVVVLRKGKARLFEMGSPMVRPGCGRCGGRPGDGQHLPAVSKGGGGEQ